MRISIERFLILINWMYKMEACFLDTISNLKFLETSKKKVCTNFTDQKNLKQWFNLLKSSLYISPIPWTPFCHRLANSSHWDILHTEVSGQWRPRTSWSLSTSQSPSPAWGPWCRCQWRPPPGCWGSCSVEPPANPGTHIWSNFMRTHIGLKICHFLQSVVSITEGPKTKLWGNPASIVLAHAGTVL